MHFEPVWHALGPFAIGTREDPWHDSVAIETLEVSDERYRSVLSDCVTWKSLEMDLVALEQSSTSISLDLSYDKVDWKGLVQIYGWAATQFDAWMRGFFWVDRDCVIRLSVRQSPEFMLDGDRYEGDIYDLGLPILLHVCKGRHQLDIRVVNEVRIFGYKANPVANIKVDASIVTTENALEAKIDKVSDMLKLNGEIRAASPYVALQLDNVSSQWVTIQAVRSDDSTSKSQAPFRLAPLQTRLVTLFMPMLDGESRVRVSYVYSEQSFDLVVNCHGQSETITSLCQPHIMTYVNECQSMDRAVIRPPLLSQNRDEVMAPVLLSLHGANVDVTQSAWKDLFDTSYGSAWIVQPDCGRWGDDWHSLSEISIYRCLKSLEAWCERHSWQGPRPDLGKIFVMGHSNGAQGAMQFMVRNSDRIIGCAIAAGYLSIARYVPTTLWSTNARVLADRPEYDITRNMEMIEGIRCFIRHGTEDDNVPVYHSRLLASLSSTMILEEVTGKGHWFDGVLTQGRLKDFVENCLHEQKVSRPRNFTVLSWGRPFQRGGVVIDGIAPRCILPARLSIKLDCDGNVKDVTSYGVDSWSVVMQDGWLVNMPRPHHGHKLRRVAEPRDATCILETMYPITIHARPNFAQRIAHSLLLYHNIDSVISKTSGGPGNWIQARRRRDLPEHTLSMHIEQSGQRIGMILEASTYAGLSRLIRLIPWRTGVGTPGRLTMDTRNQCNLVQSYSDVLMTRYVK